MDYTPEWDLTTIPHNEFYREARRRQASAPRPSLHKPSPCRWCRAEFPTTNARKAHEPLCEQNPRVKKILASQKGK